MPETPTTEPKEIVAGDTVTWKKTLSDYPATEYTLKYNIIGVSSANYSVESTADGTDHSITIPAATSADFVAGDYKWFSYVIDIGDTVRYSIASGSLVIKADPTTATDSRSHVKKTLDAIESVIEGTASKEDESYSIAGRSLSRRSLEELTSLREKYLALYQRELQEERVANGESTGRTVKVRFTNV